MVLFDLNKKNGILVVLKKKSEKFAEIENHSSRIN